MKIKDDHLLYHHDDTPYQYVRSPNTRSGLKSLYLLMHYTAGSSAEAAISTLINPIEKVSAHLVISRTGEITQLVPFDRVAWHAGPSYWENKRFLNKYSIGIELDNDGYLRPENGQWESKATSKCYPEDQVKVATHWKEFKEQGWLLYSEAQLKAALDVALVLKEKYQLIDVIGHEDVHKGKVDPGPGFPMEWFREQMFDRSGAIIEVHQTKIRTRIFEDVDGTKPRIQSQLSVSPLPAGISVKIKKKVNLATIQKSKKTGNKGLKGKKNKKGKKIRKKSQINGKQPKSSKPSDNWSLVTVKKHPSGEKNIRGWVKSEAIKKKLTTRKVEIYPDMGGVPIPDAPLHKIRSLPESTPLRILQTKGDMVLVGTLSNLPKYKYLQGWIKVSDLIRKGEAHYFPEKKKLLFLQDGDK